MKVMKNFLAKALCLGTVISMLFSASAMAAGFASEIILTIGNHTMVCDGVPKNIDDSGTVPTIIQGRTMLPIRAVVEEMGGSTAWNNDTKEVIIAYENTSIVLTINSNTAVVNGSSTLLDAAPVIIDGRTFIPVRFVAECLGFDIDWEPVTQRVTISKKTVASHVQISPVSGEITIDQAKTIALNDAKVTSENATFTTEKAGFEDGVSVYEIDFISGNKKYEYEIRVSDGIIVKAESETLTESRQNIQNRTSDNSAVSKAISETEAKSIALDEFGLTASQVGNIRVEKDIEHGKQEFDIEFYYNNAEYSCTVDAASGRVTDKEIDRD